MKAIYMAALAASFALPLTMVAQDQQTTTTTTPTQTTETTRTTTQYVAAADEVGDASAEEGAEEAGTFCEGKLDGRKRAVEGADASG